RSYVTTCAQCVDEKGEPVGEQINLGTQIRTLITKIKIRGAQGPELQVTVLSTGLASKASEEADEEVTSEELAVGGKRKFKFSRMSLDSAPTVPDLGLVIIRRLKAVLDYCREANAGKNTWQSGTLGEVTWEEACQHAFAHENFVDVIFDPDGFTKEAPMLKVRLPVYLKGDTNSCITTFTVVPTGKKKAVDYSKAAAKTSAKKKVSK
ncbi:unnamed protein product, partial [Symbiodinium sp. KB8]